MAKRLANFQWKLREQIDRRSSTRAYKYPWHEWCDGSVWSAMYGEDFQTSVESFVTTLHARASSIGKRVRTERIISRKGEEVVFQFKSATED